MATAEKILEIARSQIGTRESPANSDNVKYNTAYYGREVSGKYPWCAVFVWWVFREAGGSRVVLRRRRDRLLSHADVLPQEAGGD